MISVRRPLAVIQTPPTRRSGDVPAPTRFTPLGNQAMLRRRFASTRQDQSRLIVGPADGPLEAEANRAADAVTRDRVPGHPFTAATPTISRKCAACEDEEVGTVQTKSKDSRAGTEAPGIVRQVLRSPGHPLDPSARGYFESRFGHDFGAVRVHTDVQAAESARGVGALAYTLGKDIVFGTGEYAPQASGGRRLLAHELAHVVQQGGSGPAGGVIQRDADPEEEPVAPEVDDPSEVYDGDTPVAVAPADPMAAADPGMLSGPVADADPPVGQAGPTQADPAQAKDKPAKPAQPKPAAPKKITAIDVDQSTQTMTVTWSDGSVETHPVATGKGLPNTSQDPCKNQTEENCTPNGTFKVGRLGDGSTANSHGDAMHWYVGFVDDRGIGIHNSQPVPGVPASHGCVRVGIGKAAEAFAKKINSHVTPGKTTVTVHGKAATHPWSKAKPKPKSKSK